MQHNGLLDIEWIEIRRYCIWTSY